MPANRRTKPAFTNPSPLLRLAYSPLTRSLSTVSAAALLAAFILVSPVQADTPTHAPTLENTQELIRLGDSQDGSLLFKTDQAGHYLKAPTIQTDVNIKVSGPIIRTTLSQTFKNTSGEWVEGVYVFPLPEDAAVDRLRIIVGGRLIEGQIKEKQQARKIYAQAKKDGKKASLVEQERPNIFTASVANIGPHESVAIQIEYQDKAPIIDGEASLIFPMTVAPRFSPKPETIQVANVDGRSVPVVLDPVLDRHRITPPVMPPSLEPVQYARLPVSISIELDAGFGLESIESPYHPIAVKRTDEDSAVITLKDGDVPANRDFKLTWSASNNKLPTSQIFKEVKGEHTYLMSMITPPQFEDISELPQQAREVIFVIDTSGSMNGTSIEQAREALKLGLRNLTPKDSFNVIEFNSNFTKFFTQTRLATQQNIQRALQKTGRIKAGGGTNMAPALTQSLMTPNDPDLLQQVIFITDGAIGNERSLFAILKDRLGDKRLFPIGIGSAPNRYFISRAAKFGRGRGRVIGNVNEVAREMGGLFEDLSHPVMIDVSSNIGHDKAAYPARLPDLYDGDPIIQIAKIPTKALETHYKFSGTYNQKIIDMPFNITSAETGKGINVLWAREKIASLEESRFERQTAGAIDKEILQTALDHHIVSRLTSLVAVDITPSRSTGEALQTLNVPTQLPEGWAFGDLAAAQKTGPHNNKHLQLAPPAQSPAAQSPAVQSPARSVPVPRTASAHIATMLLGFLLMLLSQFKRGLKLLRRRQNTSKTANHA